MENKRLLEHFRQARAWIEESCYRDTLERFRGLRSEDISRDDFFAKYVYVVLASGFNVCVAQQVELKLEQALKGYDVDAIARSPDRVYRDALRVFGYEGKVCCQSAKVGHIETREDYCYEECRASSLRVLL